MRRVASFAQHFAADLGRSGVFAIGLMVFSAMFYGTSLAPARTQLAGLKAKVELLRQGDGSSGRKMLDPASRIKTFYKTFPGAENLMPAVNETYSIASRHGLVVEQADYQYRVEAGDELAAYEMSFSLKGPYPKVRDFLLEVLRMYPGAAVDSVHLRRESASAYGIEAKMRLTFFVRSRPWEYVPQDAG